MTRITLAPILRGAYIHALGTPLILLSDPEEHPELPALEVPLPKPPPSAGGNSPSPANQPAPGAAADPEAPPLDETSSPYTPRRRERERTLARRIENALNALKTPAGALPAALRIPGAGSFFIGLDYPAARRARTGEAPPLPPLAPGAPKPLPGPPRHPVQGRIALVTGGAQGFGAELSRGLADRGAFVVVADINLEGARKFADELNSRGPRRALAFHVDVSNEQSVREMARSVVAEVGGLDLLISNAGVLRSGSVLELPPADFDFVTTINYNAFFLVTQNCSPIMIRQNAAAPSFTGDIIQINSKSGLEGSNRNGAYAGGKFGGIGLVQSFAMELVEYGIKVNAVCPGNFFGGPLWSHPERGLFVQYLNNGKVPGAKSIEDVRKFYESKVPMRRGCEGPDVLKAVLYCVDQQYETGQALPVTGGQVMMR